MDVNQTLISSGITIGTYAIYKLIQFARRYYVTSACHDHTLEISIVEKPDEVKLDILKVEHQSEPVDVLQHPVK
jgi:hypothetical protein